MKQTKRQRELDEKQRIENDWARWAHRAPRPKNHMGYSSTDAATAHDDDTPSAPRVQKFGWGEAA